jgi:dCMP deaminase
MSRESWPEFYLGMARYVASRSRDPSTKVGAVIVRPDKTVASIGFNGFPRGVADTPERYEDRDFKYPAVVHAELNAILNAREPLAGHTLYCTFHPCAACASAVVQSGISCVMIPDEPIPARWKTSMDIAATILSEGGVLVGYPVTLS